MSKICFDAELTRPEGADDGAKPIVVLSQAASLALPSRGMAAVVGAANGFAFQTVVEPNGQGSHWFQVDETFLL